MIFMILIGATVFGYYMTLSRIPQEVVQIVIAMDLNRWVVVIGIVVAYFIISMFMDEIPLLLLTLQLTFPLITSLGFDPIWFGVLSMMMVAMGLVFPPVGLIAFVVSATAGVDLMKVYKGCSIPCQRWWRPRELMIFPRSRLAAAHDALRGRAPGGVSAAKLSRFRATAKQAIMPRNLLANASQTAARKSLALNVTAGHKQSATLRRRQATFHRTLNPVRGRSCHGKSARPARMTWSVMKRVGRENPLSRCVAIALMKAPNGGHHRSRSRQRV
jgi:hypothetical protein